MGLLYSFTLSICITVVTIALSVSGSKDVVFVVESSNNVNQEDFNYTIDFIYDVTKSLTIGPNDTQISLVTFNSDVTDHFVLNNCTNLPCVQNELDTVKSTVAVSTEDSTKTEDALSHVKQTSLTPENGDRTGFDNLVFLILYGQSDTKINTILASMNLKNGATVYVIGVGSMVDDSELDAIATDPSSVYKVNSGSELCNNVPDITKIIGNIDVEHTCVTTTTVTTTMATTNTLTTTITPTTTTTPTTITTSTTTTNIISDPVTTTTSTSTKSTEKTEYKDSSGDAVIIAAAVAACTLIVAISAILVFANTKVKEKCKIHTSHLEHQHMYIVQQYPDAAIGAANCKFKA